MLEGNPRNNWRRRNALHETPDRWHERQRTHIAVPGETPGLMETDRRQSDHFGLGTIRRLWRQVVAGVPAPPPFEWSRQPAVFTRAIRYRAQNLYLPAGSVNSRFSMLHTSVRMVSRQPRPMLEAGTRRGRPVVRNRMASFGSRVQPLNRRAFAAQKEKS